MAVTIHTTPLQFSPSDNPLTFTFSSTQTAQANFSYIVEVFFNAVKVTEEQVFPEVSTKSHYDCSPVVSGLVPKATYSTVVWRDSGITADVHIKVHEFYGSTPALQGNATSSTIKIFKGSLSDQD